MREVPGSIPGAALFLKHWQYSNSIVLSPVNDGRRGSGAHRAICFLVGVLAAPAGTGQEGRCGFALGSTGPCAAGRAIADNVYAEHPRIEREHPVGITNMPPMLVTKAQTFRI